MTKQKSKSKVTEQVKTPTVCKYCGNPELYAGTCVCFLCHKLASSIAYNPKAARKILRGYPEDK